MLDDQTHDPESQYMTEQAATLIDLVDSIKTLLKEMDTDTRAKAVIYIKDEIGS